MQCRGRGSCILQPLLAVRAARSFLVATSHIRMFQSAENGLLPSGATATTVTEMV